MALVWVLVTSALVSADPRSPLASPQPWRQARTPLDERPPRQFVGPHVCRTRNSTHCCPGWTSRPNSLRCVVPVCRQDCGGPGTCVAPNMCRCPGGVEAPLCQTPQYSPYIGLGNSGSGGVGGCRRICMNGGSCANGTCECAPGWSGDFCTEPICRSPCLHGGRCIAPDRCVCFHGLSGTRCEVDRRTGPCYTGWRGALCVGALRGVVCTRALCCASVGRAWGHPCERCDPTDCPTGHLRNLHTHQCQDIDECAAIPGLCSGGACVNSPGSFSCECPAGQRRHPASNNCEDIDECEDPDICPNGKCVNTEGDYYCLCNPYFIPSPDKKFCIDGRVGDCYTYLSETGTCGAGLDVPLSHRDCCCGHNMGRAWGELCAPCPPRRSLEWNHLCGGGGGSPVDPTWRRNNSSDADPSGPADPSDPTAQRIAKINECILRSGICGLGDCKDKDIGYHCDCFAGSEPTQIDGNPTCIDIDECALDYCRGGQCINKPGSFECRCPPGFDPVENGQRCSDKNECEATGMCSNGVCNNIDGGFECTCLPGYTPTESGAACVDVDECAQGAGEAGGVCRRGRCRNVPGSYTCDCQRGYSFTVGGYCTDIDECRDENVCQGGRCVNVPGSFQCVCAVGWSLSAERAACRDVDECAGGACRGGACRNAPGSFRCDCAPGLTLSPDGRTCRDEVQDLCYEKYDGGNCQNPGNFPVTRSQCCCGANQGRRLGWGMSCNSCPEEGSSEYNILCPEGAGKDNDGTDINECTHIPGICPHGTCENLEPGHRCICDPGFYPDDEGICRDVDECDMNQALCSGGTCRNTLGSYQCVCAAGWRLDARDLQCRDIDECDGESDKSRDTTTPRGDIPPDYTRELGAACEDGRCVNSPGSYQCECAPGFVLDASARRCLDNRRGSCWRRVVEGRCEDGAGALLRQECCCGVGLAWGSPCAPCEPDHCACAPGHAKLDGETCRDLDECRLDRTLCAGGTCINTDGSYRCECPPGLQLDVANSRCIDTRTEACYVELAGGRCAGAVGGDVSRAVCCCSAVGRAWGAQRCEPCPRRGSDAYDALCIFDFTETPIRVERPGYNQTSQFYPGVEDGGNGISTGNRNPWSSPVDGSITINGVGPPDVNECVAFPGICGRGRCKNLPGSFDCDCHPGYEKEGKTRKCVDIDECEIVANVCGPGECRNSPGSFTCSCHPGYTVGQPENVCRDVDECSENPALCRNGRCINTPGSFRCECPSGMELSPDRLYCKDVDECSLTSGICSNGACENLMATYQCVCDDGYSQSSVKSHCEDIDECAEDDTRCEHECVNTPGSYHCKCRDGWKLSADGYSCRDVDECLTPRVCGGGTCHNVPGTYTCTCGPGLVHVDSPPTCRDVDECAEIPELCGAGSCHNTVGSFVCRCEAGYSVRPELGPACVDDDECELGTCDCHPAADCINLPGSFQCRCRDGWRGDGFECEDVDECVSNNGGCHPHATCRNMPGSHDCLCDTGYKGDGYQCVDIDECSNDPSLCENGHCVNMPGGFKCECDVGFIPAPDAKTCLDLDECLTFDNVCVFGHCENTYGMFKCICDKGYQPDSVDEMSLGFNCTDIDECLSPQSCQYGRCVNQPGGYSCRCPSNYDLVAQGTACFDRREGPCYGALEGGGGEGEGDGARCRERDALTERGSRPACCCSVGVAWGNYCDRCPEPGSEEYRQLCPGGPGYQPILEPPSFVVTLADIDECESLEELCAHGACTNTFGSYVCACAEGWRLRGTECEDVDECLIHEICGPGVCRNLPGSYVCLCPDGYVPMPSGRECVDVRQRQCYLDWDERSGECAKAVGVPQTKYLCCCSVGKGWGSPCESCPDKNSPEHSTLCGMKPGEYIDPMTNKTNPIDECSLMPQLCKPGTCHDTDSGFQCSCDDGFVHDTQAHVCSDVDECARSPCPRRALCTNLPGGYQCRCGVGYRLSAGEGECEDIDECEEPLACSHGTCTNTLGSYRCECASGYTLRDTSCHDVDECSRPLPLCQNGTCHNVPGSYRCHCDAGFRLGYNNDCVDIDECVSGAPVCRNGRCINVPGSFRCECAPGFELDVAAPHCRDVDECRAVPEPCGRIGNPTCTNTNGGYECSCAAGYSRQAHRCADRDECRDSNLCSPGVCHNFDGGFRCECPPEWRFDAEAAVCVDERRELCYDVTQAGRCHDARPLHLSRAECCCSDGRAWGRFCELCPVKDTMEFLQVCQGGMGRPNFTQDLDECAVRPDLCRGGRCVNTDGSFRCECPPGYTLEPSGLSCVDLNECQADPRICGNGTCTNTVGGYECRCNAGFVQGPEQTCIDVDECQESGGAGCAFRCHNVPGTYRCTCPMGYVPGTDAWDARGTCHDVDECAHDPPPCPYCKNTVGSYVCGCPPGYTRTSSPFDSAEACADVDECARNSTLCGVGACENTEGGYRCRCPPGYVPDADTCLDQRRGACYRSLVGGACVPGTWARRGVALSALADHVTKAECCCSAGAAWGEACEVCPAGGVARLELCRSSVPGVLGGGAAGAGGAWGGGEARGGGDVDECAAMPALCAPGRCVNTVGSFRCVCARGWRWAGDVCADEDECVREPCQHHCTNTEGSYKCSCRAGYELDLDGSSCVDVDECARNSHTCQQNCTNTRGSYTCSCRDGYETSGDSCIDINECLDEGICPTPGKCVNLVGSYRCVCPRGFRRSIEGDRCVDRDECAEGRCAAPCRNYAGSYSCPCPPGSTRSPSGTCTRTADPCAEAPCGAAACSPLGATYRCACPPGYLWGAGVCLQMGGGCAQASCLFACQNIGDSYQCGCPDNYQMVSSHCFSPQDHQLALDDIGSAPVYPVQDQYRTDSDNNLLSTEGCFSCQMNARHRRHAPDEGLVFANGTTILRRNRRRTRRGRRSLLEPEAELVVIKRTPKQTWGRTPILNLTPAEGEGKPHYRIAYGNENKDFVLSKHNGIWSLRLRRHVKPDQTLDRQIEIEARFVPVPEAGRRRDRRHLDLTVPAPVRLYVTVQVAPSSR